jgi:hypothetical protein
VIFWSSSEATNEASERFRPIRKKVESEINPLLEKITLEAQWEGWKWAFIAIIMSEEFDQDYPERVRRNIKNRVLEFRLKLDHDLFVRSSPVDQLSQYFGELRRSVEMMAKWKMSSKDRSILLNVIKDVEAMLVQENDQPL